MSGLDRRAAVDRSVLAYVDLADQQPAEYVLSVDVSPVQSLVFYVDGVRTMEGRVQGLVCEPGKIDQIVVDFAPSIPWHAIKAKYVDVVTTEQMIRKSAADHDVMHRLQKEVREASECSKDETTPETMLRLVQKDSTGQYL